jgi:para-nitrobenzyl esterase
MNHSFYRRAALCAVLLAGALTACGGGGGAAPQLRTTQFGLIEGVDDSAASGTYQWKGIPFAKAPVKDLRWKPPVDPDPWSTAIQAKQFANACVQYGRIYGPGANNRYDETIGTTLNTSVGSEDCLALNIWRPASGDTNLPVIVFFHGGSNVSGYTADPMYDGANLAKAANAVVVTANFRLGIFGFLNLPQLKTGDSATDSGNFALLDNIKALQFVNRNIGVFGGDPANVTIMGQSAGAINVYALLTSPLVAAANPRLFQKAIPLSGGISLASDLPPGSVPTLNPASTALAQGNALLNNLLIADGKATDTASAQAFVATQSAAQIADYLRNKTSAAMFTTLLTKLALVGLSGSGPIPDGAVVATDPVAAVIAGNYAKAPVLAGNTRDEGKLFPSFLPLVGGSGNARIVSDAALFANHFGYKPNDAAQTTIDQWIAPSYLPVDAPVTGFTARAEQLNKVFFLASRDNILNALKSQQPGVWYYRFDWSQQPAPWNDIYGAAHVFDLPFVFGNFGPSLFSNVMNTTANQPGRLDLSNAMMKSVAAFAQKGDPNDPVLGVTWPTWPAKLVFDASKTAKQIRVE